MYTNAFLNYFTLFNELSQKISFMKLCEILSKDKIISEFRSKSKDDIINEIVDLFKDDSRIDDIEEVRSAVREREKIMSTGVGKGFAIPHAKTDGVNDIIAAFGKSSVPIDFEALDGKPVQLVFLLIGRTNLVGPHIKLLSRISRMMNKDEFRESLLKASTAEEIYKIFCHEEKKYFDLG